MTPRVDQVISDLERLIEELDDIAFDDLRAAAADKRGRPASDRRLTQARRALEKAVHALRESNDRGESGGWNDAD